MNAQDSKSLVRLLALVGREDHQLLADDLGHEVFTMRLKPTCQRWKPARGRIRLTDQLLFRFIKLQDALGERLVPATLAGLAKPFADRPMRDRLNRLEKLGFLDVDNRPTWREVRQVGT